jgi:hypothetical protein
MRQVLDMVTALEQMQGVEEQSQQRIVWRLTEAHTNSPPFTVTAEAFAFDPAVSIGLEVDRVTATFTKTVDAILSGHQPLWIDSDVLVPLRRIFKRNLNGVGQTSISIGDGDAIAVTPATAKIAVATLDRLAIDEAAEKADLRRTEYGASEVEVCGISKWNDRPALLVIERLSRQKIPCVLTDELAATLGPDHNWSEAWEGRRLVVSGALHYGPDGFIKRIHADQVEDLPWTEVRLSDLRDIDLLNGRSVTEHLKEVWGDDDGQAD